MTVPHEGQPSIYYSLDVDGRILRIDYEAKKSKVVGRVPLDTLPPSALPWGWYLPEESFAYLFARAPGSPEGSNGNPLDRLYGFQGLDGVLRPLSVQLYAGDDSDIVPLSQKAIFVASREAFFLNGLDDSRKNLDRTTLHAYSDFAAWPEGMTVFGKWHHYEAYERQWDVIERIDAKQGTVMDAKRLEDILGIAANDRGGVSLKSIAGSLGLARVFDREVQASRLVLFDLTQAGILATSPPVEVQSVQYVIAGNRRNGVQVAQLALKPHSDTLESTGRMTLFEWTLGSSDLVPQEPREYDAKAEFVLLAPEGRFRVFPRYRFDCATIEDLNEYTHDGKWGATTQEERNEIVGHLRKELVTDGKPEGWRALSSSGTVVHLVEE